MTLQFSTTGRNAMLDALEDHITTQPDLIFYSVGAGIPANCAAADSSGAVALATIACPLDWLAAAASGAKALAGSWQIAAAATGVLHHFRLKKGGVTHMQGTVTAAGGGGDMIVQSTSITAGQTITVVSFTITAGGA